MDFPVKNLLLQGDADADGHTINNLDLTGLGLTKSSVGLGNVDNTSDALKPVSAAMAAALALKEPSITAGTADQYWRGDKSWQTLGALALQSGDTTLQSLSAIGLNATSGAEISARRNDHSSGPSFAKSSIGYYGASDAGSLLGLSRANAGAFGIINSTLAFIYTNNTSPLIFGYNGVRRMRLMTGLNIGGDTDPGAGCISATGNINAAGNIEAVGSIESLGSITATGTILGGTIGGGIGIITTTLEVGGNLTVGGSITGNLPGSDPGVPGQLYRDGADVKVSL